MKALYQFALLASFLPTVSFAGVLNGGGGGKSVVCNLSGKTTVQTLDLYEAENVYHLSESPRRTDLNSEFALGLERLWEIWALPGREHSPPPSDEAVNKRLNEDFFSKVFYIPPGRRLPLTDDATVPVVPAGCEIAQVIINSDLGIEVDRDYWDKMDARNQAALILHEILYLERRDYGSTNSDETRRFVGRVFSTTPPTPRFADTPKHGYFECMAGESFGGIPMFGFEVYPGAEDGRTGTLISFGSLAGPPTLGRTTVFIGADMMRQFEDPDVSFTEELTIHSETSRERRNFYIKKEGGDTIKITVWVRDRFGNETKPASGSCVLVK